MCVDDYQFRHLSTKKQKVCRRFSFISVQGHERTFLVNISQFQRFGQLCLCEILLHLSKKGLNVRDYFFYMPQFDINIEAGDKCRVPFDIMDTKEVIFEIKKIQGDQLGENYQELYIQPQGQDDFDAQQLIQNNQQNQQFISKVGSTTFMSNQFSLQRQDSLQNNESTMQQQKISQKPIIQQYIQNFNIKVKQIPDNVNNINNNGQAKKPKQLQKKIEQAIFKTKTWRMLHINCSFSLKNAANMVGLSKKTLDDYFLVLRVGEQHKYNFRANLDKKIGHLRAFIRSQPVKVTGRLTKQVKCFSLVPEPDLSYILNHITRQKMQNIVQQKMGQLTQLDQEEKINESQMVAQ